MKNWSLLTLVACLSLANLGFAAVPTPTNTSPPIDTPTPTVTPIARDDFEDLEVGPLPQGGWSGAGAIQTAVVFSGEKALQINPDGQVDRLLAGSDQVIYLEGYYRAENLDGEVPDFGTLQPASSVLVFMTTPGIVALNGDGGGSGSWVFTGVSLSPGSFYRITLRQDYGSQTWDLFVDGDPIAKLSGLGFKDNTVAVLSGMRVKAAPGDSSFLDDLYVGVQPPDFLISTSTPTLTDTPIPTDTPTPTETLAPIDTPTPTPTAPATDTPTPTETLGPTNTPTVTPTAMQDTDGDGIPDIYEGPMFPPDDKTNMYLTDSDGDGIEDGMEDYNRDGVWQPASELNPRNRDTDGDGLWDGIEVFIIHSNPMDPNSPPVQQPDADNDHLPEPWDPDPTTNDADGDRFTDAYEAVKLGLPAVSDSNLRPTLGDVDGNANWDNADAQLILNFFSAQPTPNFNPDNSDLNCDGRIDNADAQSSLGFFVEQQPVLPVNAPRQIDKSQ